MSGFSAELSLPTGLKLTPLTQTSLSLSWDPAPVTDPAKDDWYYKVECEQAEHAATAGSFQLPLNSTGVQLNDLRPRHKYRCRVSVSRAAGHNCPTVSAWTLSDGKLQQAWCEFGLMCESLSRDVLIGYQDH